MKTLLIAATLGLGLFAVQANADHSIPSPRGQELFGHKVTARGGSTAGNTLMPIGPAAKSPLTRETMAKGVSTDDVNLVRSQTYTGRSPFAQNREFEIAPLGKGKECAADCTMDCCKK